MTRLGKGGDGLIAYRTGFAHGYLGLDPDHDYPAGSREAGAFEVGFRVGRREGQRYSPRFGAQSLRRSK